MTLPTLPDHVAEATVPEAARSGPGSGVHGNTHHRTLPSAYDEVPRTGRRLPQEATAPPAENDADQVRPERVEELPAERPNRGRTELLRRPRGLRGTDGAEATTGRLARLPAPYGVRIRGRTFAVGVRGGGCRRGYLAAAVREWCP